MFNNVLFLFDCRNCNDGGRRVEKKLNIVYICHPIEHLFLLYAFRIMRSNAKAMSRTLKVKKGNN